MTAPGKFSLISGKISVRAPKKDPDEIKNRLYVNGLDTKAAGRTAGEFRGVGRELAAEFGG